MPLRRTGLLVPGGTITCMELTHDCAYTLDEALAGTEAPHDVYSELRLIPVMYHGFDGHEHRGQLVLHRELIDDVLSIFEELFSREFPLQSVIPIVAFGWDDTLSMIANNSSAFNYRTISGTGRLSSHALGRAIDINPVQNPCVTEQKVAPRGATYDPGVAGTVTEEVANLFRMRGWVWGGDWTSLRDWQHFEKRS